MMGEDFHKDKEQMDERTYGNRICTRGHNGSENANSIRNYLMIIELRNTAKNANFSFNDSIERFVMKHKIG